MDQQVSELAAKLIQDAKYFAAVAGFFGVLCGSIVTFLGNLLLHLVKERPQSKMEKLQKQLLLSMLSDGRFPDKWRRIETLCAVIGEDEPKTKQLLIQIRARGSERTHGLWGLIKNHPLSETET